MIHGRLFYSLGEACSHIATLPFRMEVEVKHGTKHHQHHCHASGTLFHQKHRYSVLPLVVIGPHAVFTNLEIVLRL